jgi:hypothetical protein
MPAQRGVSHYVKSNQRNFATTRLAEREELGSNILHLETPEIQIASYRSSSPRGAIGRKVLFGNTLIPSLACQREPTISDKERAPPIAARRRPATLT